MADQYNLTNHPFSTALNQMRAIIEKKERELNTLRMELQQQHVQQQQWPQQQQPLQQQPTPLDLYNM